MLRRFLLILLALFFLFEAWLWEKLAPIVAWIVERLPFARLKQALARSIEELPPPATLVVFIVPFILLLPLKILEVWMLAQRQLGRPWSSHWSSPSWWASASPPSSSTSPATSCCRWRGFARFYDWVMRGSPGRTSSSIRSSAGSGSGSGCSGRGAPAARSS